MKEFDGYRVLLAEDDEIAREIVANIVDVGKLESGRIGEEVVGDSCSCRKEGEEVVEDSCSCRKEGEEVVGDSCSCRKDGKFHSSTTTQNYNFLSSTTTQNYNSDPALASNRVYLFTAEVEMKDSYAEKGFDGILLKPANLEALKRLLS